MATQIIASAAVDAVPKQLSSSIANLDSADMNLTESSTTSSSEVATKPTESTPMDTQLVSTEVERKKVWGCQASLYCPKTGYSHSIMQKLSLDDCPACEQNFTKEVQSEAVKDNKPSTDLRVSYEVSYQDNKGRLVGREDWPGLLDLNEARKGVALKSNEGVMKVISMVWTTHLINRHSATYGKSIMDQGIIENPRIDVTSQGTRIEICSQRFIALLRGLVAYYPEVDLDMRFLLLQEPYGVIAHHLSEIEEFQSTYEPQSVESQKADTSLRPNPSSGICDKETHQHIDVVLNFLKGSIWKDRITEEQKRHQKQEAMATFAMLWLLYRPGTTVYVESEGRLAAYVTQYRNGLFHLIITSREAQRVEDRIVIDCSSYWEQRRIGHMQKKPKKKKKRYVPDSDSKSDDEDANANEKEPELMEDFGYGRWKEYDLIDPLKDSPLELVGGPDADANHRYMLCSKRLMGFALKSRTWHIFDVENCHEAKVSKVAIDTLVMPEDKKRLIKALVHRYATGSGHGSPTARPWNADFIEKEGEGKIFLLHGSPGVGKIFTAECIAEFTGRPLLSLTCGDLGNDETKLEKQISVWFKLAERWGAVMLLDEADVYTERRFLADLKRNTMVSIFLRCMEYYRGSLFLTTNRVGTFDDAFVSRIHVVIHYKDLDEEDRKKIWKRFF
ncbi:Uu.00g027460.m01.CDS01 [Anthostomella pinea]|uniref:Uu.00g027460.m01.CDS01 n=1 Tax=Anthostomella pinea TaxID=933095 RepID=A0AAI8YCU3_9PEZI|nr:Uu.00g027460.m01.CDS01 [Anthostomella pinea]